MATSGTVATTAFDTATLIEHAFRRAKVKPSAQTPETIQIAKNCLYLILLNLSNRGLNLWAVEKCFVGLQANRAQYDTPDGTLDVLNALRATPTLLTDVVITQDTVTPPSGPDISNGATATFGSSEIVRVGFSTAADFTGAVTVQTSTQVLATFPASSSYVGGQYYWVEPTVAETTTAVQILASNNDAIPVIADIVVASAVTEVPLTIWNRDTYASIPNKWSTAQFPTNYFLEKKLTPTITVWPVPTGDETHLTLYRHRQPQDVGTLIQQVEVPQRWFDGVVWLLAAKIGFELPEVDATHLQLLIQMADKMEFEAEQAETDGAPIYITPGIGVYTR